MKTSKAAVDCGNHTRRRGVVLDLCGGTGSWSEPYAEAGYDVHILSLPVDVRTWERPQSLGVVRGILAAPPCTVFSCASAGTWATRPAADLVEALSVVDACIRLVYALRPRWWALENPKGRLRRWLGDPELIFQPWHYGDPWTKLTCLWGRFTVPRRRPARGPYAPMPGTSFGSPRGRAVVRAMTPPGFARAFYEANP